MSGYVLTGSIITPPGQTLEITADDQGPTQEKVLCL